MDISTLQKSKNWTSWTKYQRRRWMGKWLRFRKRRPQNGICCSPRHRNGTRKNSSTSSSCSSRYNKLFTQLGLYDQIKAGKSQYHKKALEFWSDYGAKKIVLNGKDHEQLQNLQKECKKNKIPSYLVADAGHTQLEPGTVTVLGIGPDSSEKINKITGKLRLLK